MNRTIELLAPGGDVDAVKAAIVAGVDAVYCGLDKFNARNRAANISFENLQGILRLAHENNCKVFLTLNILIVDSEITALIKLLNKLINTSIDGVIVQDLGMLYLLSKYFKGLNIHASTQLTTHNEGQIKFLAKLNTERVNLSRELNINEIKALTAFGHKNNVLTEVFVHGSYCISFSGICYMSSVISGNSGNRGRCSQPCRDRYERTSAGKNYPLNLKDNSAFFDLKELAEAGVDSLKIEGRIKEFEYVYTVVDVWKKQIQSFYNQNKLIKDNSELYKVFNRDFSNGYLRGEISKDMFIDNPMTQSSIHYAKTNQSEIALFEEKDKLRNFIKSKIDPLSIDKIPLFISVSGKRREPLKVKIETPNNSFQVISEANLETSGTQVLDHKMVLKRFKAFNETEYFIKDLNLDSLENGVFISFNELTSLKKRILYLLNKSKDLIFPVVISKLKKHAKLNIKPTLSVIISSAKDIVLCMKTSAEVYFQLPANLKNEGEKLIELFLENKSLIPYFPSILIGEDYQSALAFLEQVKPQILLTDNTGIAYHAFEKGIPWIAGPHLNTTNSFSLKNLKENFNCSGAFISNEISKIQMGYLKRPENFNLFYTIYQPLLLMTSRQCLFHQVTGCDKITMDDKCIKICEKSGTITNLKKDNFIIKKNKGNYNQVYNGINFLNTDVNIDMPDLFSGFFIDLRDIKTETKIAIDKLQLINLFQNLLNKEPDAESVLHKVICPITNAPYKKGI